MRVSSHVRAVWTAGPGVLMVGFALQEVFRDLFHPTMAGSLSDYVARTIFRLFRRSRSTLALAGPLALIVVIVCWAFLLGVGFALIYWSDFPGGFRSLAGQAPDADGGFWQMLSFSLATMTTLGLGDLLPEPDWLRVLVTIEALMGFALVTASVSWIVLLYPALGRMRTLARRTWILAKAEQRTGIHIVSDGAEQLFGDLARGVIEARVDFIHFPIIYYFHAEHRQSSLAEAVAHLARFAELGSKPEAPERVRLASSTLRAALDDLADILAERFLRIKCDDLNTVFRAYAKDHVTRIATP